MSYTLQIDHQHKLIRYRHCGDLKVEDIGQAWDELVSFKEFTHIGYNLLSDYREATFDFSLDNINLIISILEEMSFLKKKKQAMIIEDPYSTAGALIFETEVYKKTGFIVKIFSTHHAALDWASKSQ